MGTTSRLIEVLPSQMREIAFQVRRLREELRLTQEDLAEQCNRAARELLDPGDLSRVARMSRSRIAHIEQAHLPRPGKGVAIALQPHEVRLLAHALGVAPEQLVGDHAEGIITWDPLTNPRRAHHFLTLFDTYAGTARELTGWAEFLPCSLETRDFMHAHHLAIFSADTLHLEPGPRAEYVRAVVTMYDTIGDRRREQVVTAAAARPWTFTHLILRSDLERIARGTDPYEGIPAAVRRECLANLRGLVSDGSLRIRLEVAEDDAGMRHLFAGFDSLVVIDDAFSFWRYGTGDIAYTAHPDVVRVRRALIETFRTCAVHREARQVIGLLDGLLASVA
jgi:transcriptional regulator with XRE-family HTH domain